VANRIKVPCVPAIAPQRTARQPTEKEKNVSNRYANTVTPTKRSLK